MNQLRRVELVPLSYRLAGSSGSEGFEVVLTHQPAIPSPLFGTRRHGVSLEVTESCMCRCIMCNVVGLFKKAFMPYLQLLRCIQECGLLGISLINLFGGEVTLRRDLFHLIRQARWSGMNCMFITSGYYITPSYVRRLKEVGVSRVMVSLDGSRPEIHDAIRQLPGIYRKAIRGIKALINEPSIEVYVASMVLTENLDDLVSLIRRTGRLGVRTHEFFLPVSGPASSSRPRWPSEAEINRILDELIPAMDTEAARWGTTLDWRPEIRSWRLPRQETVSMLSSGVYNVHSQSPSCRCPAAGFNLFLAVDGSVFPCDMPGIISSDAALGNLADQTLLELVTSPAMQAFSSVAGQHPACRMCVGQYEAIS
jgi:radical SAM protein with 4Fe4S-binding SPASM domain